MAKLNILNDWSRENLHALFLDFTQRLTIDITKIWNIIKTKWNRYGISTNNNEQNRFRKIAQIPFNRVKEQEKWLYQKMYISDQIEKLFFLINMKK